MTIHLEYIVGISVGIELLEDEEDMFLIFDLFFIRVLVDLG